MQTEAKELSYYNSGLSTPNTDFRTAERIADMSTKETEIIVQIKRKQLERLEILTNI